MRLFCFAYAGGGASAYFKWTKAFPPHIAVCPVLLPGRETAIGQTPIADMDLLLACLADALAPVLDQPYAFFGYSLGAKLAYGLTHHLHNRGHQPPALLTVAASRDPASLPHRPGAHLLPETEFVAYLRDLGGTPEEVLADRALLDLMLPALRADFALVERPMPLQPVTCPIVACGGTEDPVAPPAKLFGWGRFTSSRFVLRAFPGSHFFLREQMGPLIASLIGDLEEVLAA
jgi:medium-chain acyl-[acyl-carrier-protein] hydrolase